MPALRLAFALAASWLVSVPAHAQFCAGFTDVLAANPFCDNIAWIKNRGVTLGCDTNLYCPGNQARRDQMAAFMSRLGKALTPVMLSAQEEAGPMLLPASGSLLPCVTPDTPPQLAPVQYPRQASVVATMSARADGAAAGVNAFVLVSTDGGSTWANFNGSQSVGVRASAQANSWLSVTAEERMDLAAGTNYRFALGMRRDNLTATAGNLAQVRCQIVATVQNRNAATPPL